MKTDISYSVGNTDPIDPMNTKGVVVQNDLVGEALWLHSSGWHNSSNYTGKAVNEHIMLETAAVWSAIRLIAESVAALPLHLYRSEGDSDVKATDYYLYNKLNKQPHKYLTTTTFVESLAVSMCIWNQGYIKVSRVGERVVSLQALPKSWVRPYSPDSDRNTRQTRRNTHDTTISFKVREGGADKVYKWGEIIPVRGFGHAADLEGLSVAGVHKNAIGLSMAAEEFGAKFFTNGARPSGVFTYDKTLHKEQRERIREQLQEKYAGGDNAYKIMVLEAGMQYAAMQATNDQSQFIETRKNQILEICRIFRVPPHKLMEMGESKYNTVAEENRAFLVDTLQPYLTRIEQALDCWLLTNEERERGYFVRFNVEGKLRADFKTRTEGYQRMIQTGVMTPNEARAKENLPPLPGGDKLFIPLNMAPAAIHEDVLLKGSGPVTSEKNKDE